MKNKLINNSIRIASLKDVDELLPLFTYGYNFHLINRPDIFVKKKDNEFINIINDYIQDENTNIIVKEVNDCIIGYLAYEIIEKATKSIFIDELVINKAEQGKGYAKELLLELDIIAKELNCKRIEFGCWTFNKNALSMYEHMSYKKQKIVFEKDI